MKRLIKWTHSTGETVEYKNAQALANILGVGLNTVRKYLRAGFSSDADVLAERERKINQPPKKRQAYSQRTQVGYSGETKAIRRLSRKPEFEASDKRYRDFIAEMETWK